MEWRDSKKKTQALSHGQTMNEVMRTIDELRALSLIRKARRPITAPPWEGLPRERLPEDFRCFISYAALSELTWGGMNFVLYPTADERNINQVYVACFGIVHPEYEYSHAFASSVEHSVSLVISLAPARTGWIHTYFDSGHGVGLVAEYVSKDTLGFLQALKTPGYERSRMLGPVIPGADLDASG